MTQNNNTRTPQGAKDTIENAKDDAYDYADTMKQGAKDIYNNVKDKAEDAYHTAKEATQQSYDYVKSNAIDLEENIITFVKEHPVKAVSFGILGGILLYQILKKH